MVDGIFSPCKSQRYLSTQISCFQNAVSWGHNEIFAHWKFRGRVSLTYEFVPNLVLKCDFRVRVARDFQIFWGFDWFLLIGWIIAHLLSFHGVIALVFARFIPAAIFSLSCDWLIWFSALAGIVQINLVLLCCSLLEVFLYSANREISHLSSFQLTFVRVN